MTQQLTEQQKQAVDDRGGRLLVSAAAGSGKTKVLVDRLMSYLCDENDPADIDEFLIITYTKAAAAQLRGKIAAQLTQRLALKPQNMHLQRQLQRLYLTKISTVHAFCGDILREYAFELHLPGDFRVADENECNELRERVVDRVLTQFYEEKTDDVFFRAFADTQGFGRDDRLLSQIVLQVYDSARCHADARQWLDKCREAVRANACTDAVQTVYGGYLMQKTKEAMQEQIAVMERCAALMSAQDGCEKPTALLNENVLLLRSVAQARTWEEVHGLCEPKFGTLRFPKDFDEEQKLQIKTMRDGCKKETAKLLAPFADDSAQVLRDMASSSEAVEGLIALVDAFGESYGAAKRSRRILDFSDLEHKMLDLLLGKQRTVRTAAAREIGARFREVMVDEYQDSNAVQDAIYAALTDDRKNLFMVGDVKQSIYQFRLADPSIFLEKYDRFLDAGNARAGEDRKVLLTKNFRSRESVLEACNDVFRSCMSVQVGGMDYTQDVALHKGGEDCAESARTQLHCIRTEQETYPEEAAFVADHIRRLLDSGEYRPEDIAILLRSPGSAGGYFRKALDEQSIRYATGGGVDMLQTEEIGTLYAILQMIYNPRLDIPLVAALSSPAFGFTADDLAAVRERHTKCAFYDALRCDDSGKSRAFMRQLKRLRAVMCSGSLTQIIEQILLETSMQEVYGAMENGNERVSNIRSFYQLAVEFEAAGKHDLGRFLEYLQSMQQKGLISASEQSMPGCVTIMSIHKSKGLEFPVVYLCNLSREFNAESRRAAVLCHKELGLGLSAVDREKRLRYPTLAKRAIAAKIGEESLSEELRVLYVAMTRAKERLVMTYASKKLDQKLTDMVQRLQLCPPKILARKALCPGDWVLLTALRKTEAGELHAIAGKPAQTESGKYPWDIHVVCAPQPTVAPAREQLCAQPLEESLLAELSQGLSFRYPHAAAVSAPSKLTATGLKGRYQDEEAAEKTPLPATAHCCREASFAIKSLQGKDYGNALHLLMQHIDYAACGDVAQIRAEIVRLTEQNFLTSEQAATIRPETVAAFFNTPLGKKLRQGNVVREFKFSILRDAAEYDRALVGERVLLQGVVDCALIEDDGITIIDFKTDRVSDENMAQKIQQYAPQVHAYAEAMQRIYQKEIKQTLLYFFHTAQFVPIV